MTNTENDGQPIDQFTLDIVAGLNTASIDELIRTVPAASVGSPMHRALVAEAERRTQQGLGILRAFVEGNLPIFAIDAGGTTYKVVAPDLAQAQLELVKRVGVAVVDQVPLLGGIDIRGMEGTGL
jgi:hypothetical protein